MRIEVLTAAVLLLGTCVRSQPGGNGLPTGSCSKLTKQECNVEDDIRCKDEIAGEMGRCNTEKGYCCDVSADGGLAEQPKCAPTSTSCANDGDCSALTSAKCENGKCCEDLSSCTDTTEIIRVVLMNPNCMNIFNGAVGTDVEFNSYCSSLIGGLSCVADQLVPGSNNAMCKQLMLRTLMEKPSIVFEQIKNFAQLSGMQISFNEAHVNNTNNCPGLMEEPKCEHTETSCVTDGDCSSLDRAQCKDGKCCKYMQSDELDSPCPGLDSDDDWGFGECTALTDCTETSDCGENQACCGAGSCQQKCLPDLGRCVDTDVIIAAVIDLQNMDCFLIFSAAVTDGVTFADYCSSLVGGLNCIAEKLVVGPYSAMCKDRMLRYVKARPDVIFTEIERYLENSPLTLNVNQDYVRDTSKCPELKDIGEDDDKSDDDDSKEKDDDDWNTSCPKMNHAGGLCPAACTTNDDCSVENDVCCNVGGEQCHACMPDLKQCADLDRTLTSTCFTPVKVISLLSQDNRDGFCRHIWDILNCSARQIVRQEYTKLCLERIAMLLKYSPNDILGKIRALAQNRDTTRLDRFMKDVSTECEGSPLYEHPSRPVPDDVKACASLSAIQEKAGQCDRITASNPTNAACGQLKSLVTCIADKIAAGKDEIEKRKCAGEIYKFIEENRQRLTNTFGNLNSKLCEEREYVCGDDLKPMDGLNCSTSRCPASYVCRNSYCCPMEKEGWCPKQEVGAPAMCNKGKCEMDSECEDNDEKCCFSAACRRKTCMKRETQSKSRCDTLYENGRRQLEQWGICADRRKLTQLPSCQNTRFSLMQMNLWTGRGHCVTEDGQKIRGSDFTGNRDCTKVREGRCPEVPQVCRNGGNVRENICQSNDFKCKDGQKCCLAETGGLCVRMCVTAATAPENVPDDCQDRKCCPITLCQDKKCPGDVTAVCRINSCGGCKAEFYSLTEKVNCTEGVSMCQRKRTEAQEQNAKRRKSDAARVLSLLKSRDRSEREKQWTGDGMAMKGDGSETEDDDGMSQDEYGEWRHNKEALPEDTSRGSDDDGEGGSMLMKEFIQQSVCDTFEKMSICKNGGQCTFGSGESFFEFCKCPTGYYGLFCEHIGTVKPIDTHCNRNMYRIKSAQDVLMNQDHAIERMVLQDLFNKIKIPSMIMPHYTCDDVTGKYKPIQMGTLLPKTSDMMNIYYCVDKETGTRIEGTPVTSVMSEQMPNCTLTSIMPDPMSQSPKCIAWNKREGCTEGNCQYYWDQTAGVCQKKAAGHGFSTLNDCYDQCGINRACTNDRSETTDDSEEDHDNCEMGITYGPKPCRLTVDNTEIDGCDYNTQFCHVEETASGQIGTCKDFQGYCLERPNSGYGYGNIGAYYFNAKTGRCDKFTYKGHGGNKNRFYSLHQCRTECGTRPYKFEDIACPPPRKLAKARMDKMAVSTCDNDYHCHVNQVCCSDDKVRVCTDPIHTCMSVRCPFNGACDEGGRCVCKTCSTTTKAEVCGSDGKTYDSVCHLEQHSCQTMKDITVASTGPCSTCGDSHCESYETCDNNKCVSNCPDTCTAQYQPVCGKGVRTGTYHTFSSGCDMERQACTLMEKFVKVNDSCCITQDMPENCMMSYCTLEYKPLCTYDTTTKEVKTYANPCLSKQAMMNGRTISVLYPGKCQEQCEVMQSWINNTCGCQNACTKEYSPICAQSTSGTSDLKTFSNVCVMRAEGCNSGKIYVIKSHGPCVEPEPVYECPANRPDRVASAVISCNTDNHAGCDTDMGEMCCPFGAGQKCLPKKVLVRRKEMKSGICPEFYGLNYDSSRCPMDKCTSDDECVGEAKCCMNKVCGHMTCAEPAVKDDESHCGANARMVSRCAPKMTETGCPSAATCKAVRDGDGEIGVCCMPNGRADADTELANSMMCHLMEMVGSTCENGGTCVGDLGSGTVCKCMDGFYGFFCEKTSPPSEEATLCLARKTVMMALNKTGLISDGPGFDDFVRNRENREGMGNKRKRRDDHMEEEDDHMEDGDEDMEQELNPFLQTLMKLMKHMGMHGILQNVADLCTADGHFRTEQCMRDFMSGSHYCYCVFPQTGIPVQNGPKAMRVEDLTCSDLTNNMGLQPFCTEEKPELDMDMCEGPTMIDRFYYNPAIMDCEMFTDYGCNEKINNIFDSYDTCKSACGVKSSSASMMICSRVRCGNGEICRVKNGTAVCVDPDSGNSMFEPACDMDGKFKPKQCHGKVCACVNPDTGEVIANSVAEGEKLQCNKEGGTVTPVRQEAKSCTGNRVAQFCKNGGDECTTNCQLKENAGNMRNSDRVVDDNNICINCESCPSGQGGNRCAVPETYCQNKCTKFPDADCFFNTCKCKEEYMANDRIVNCSAAQSECQIEKHRVKQVLRKLIMENGGQQLANGVEIRCSSTGTYLAECTGNLCHCTNATDGTKIGNIRYTPENIISKCNATQRKTKVERVKLRTILSKLLLWSGLSQSKKTKVERTFRIEVNNRGLAIISIKFFDGSIGSEIVVGSCGTGQTDCDVTAAETTDVSSLALNLQAEINTGSLAFEVDGETFTASDASITEIVTTEELYGPVTEEVPEEDDDKTTIIIVVVVVVVVVIIAVGIACYCYQKANKSKNKDIPFTDIQGKNNPAYGHA